MPRRNGQVLIVDDEIEVQRILARTLERAGLEVDSVGTFQEAREATQECHYHLLLVDLSLPDQSGLDLIRDVRQQDDSPSVIIITGHPSVRTVAEAMQLGVRNYLTKPISPTALVEAVQAVLASDGVLVNTEEQFLAEMGSRLKAARHEANLTMRAVGDRIGISQAQISQIEAGLSAPSLSTLFRLVRALRVKMADLFKDL